MRDAPVSVVIPSFNSAHLVTQAIESVLAQTVVPAEVLVVDDGSADDTRERVAPYAPRVRYLHQSNQGVSAARNRGVAAATQPFVAFLDADDVWHPHKTELQMGAFERHPELGLVGTGHFAWPADSFPDVGGGGTGAITSVSWSQLVVRNYLSTSSIVARRAVLREAGPFDTAMQGPEDRDLWLRVAETAPVANLELPLMGYRDVQGSVSKQGARCQAGMLRILEKLDERAAWGGRWLLRRKSYSYVYHACACIYAGAGEHAESLSCSLKSLLWYPLPYGRGEVTTRGERLRRLLVNFLRWAGLKRGPTPRPTAPRRAGPEALPLRLPRPAPQASE